METLEDYFNIYGGKVHAKNQEQACKIVDKMVELEDFSAILVPDFNDLSYLFAGKYYENLSELRIGLNTSRKNSYDLSNMFDGCELLTSSPAFYVQYAGYAHEYGILINSTEMFKNCKSLKQAYLGADKNFYCDSADDMFKNCNSLKRVGSITFANIIDNPFKDCPNLSEIYNLEFIDCTVPELFAEYKKLTEAHVQFRNTTATRMFEDCSSLKSINILSSGSTISGICYNCKKLKSVVLDERYSVSNDAFYNCIKLEEVITSNYDHVDISSGRYMFYNCSKLKMIPKFYIESNADITGMFDGCSELTDVPEFELGSGVNIEGMFNNCESLENVGRFHIKGNVHIGDPEIFIPSMTRNWTDLDDSKLIDAIKQGVFDGRHKFSRRYSRFSRF